MSVNGRRPLSAVSEACLYRFRTYNAPPEYLPPQPFPFCRRCVLDNPILKVWNSNFAAPWTRRASVLILLWGDRNGDLQVALTTRSKQLRTHAGDVALPGGTYTSNPLLHLLLQRISDDR